MVDTSLISGLIDLRRELHKRPEISGQEANTANRIIEEMKRCKPDHLLDGIGGHGVIAIWDSGNAGPSIMLRAELDGLPIIETSMTDWGSEIHGRGHLCGHDGHMAILVGVARYVAEKPIRRGRLILLFQPSEEDGRGAAAMLADPAFEKVHPDIAFSLHNLPGLPLGSVTTRRGPLCYASEGLSVGLTGRTAHASQPELGSSPAQAMCRLITHLPALPVELGPDHDDSLVTLVHARLGEEAFGIAPGEAHVMATLRAIDDRRQHELMAKAELFAKHVASETRLELRITRKDGFAASINNVEATNLLEQAFQALSLNIVPLEKPFRFSEDFGRFGQICPTAMFMLGAGEGCPPLHAPDYDFPDSLLPLGIEVFTELVGNMCGYSRTRSGPPSYAS